MNTLPVSSCNTTNLPSLGSCPTFNTFPSLTAITGEPCLAKIDVDLAAGSEDTATAGFPLLTRVLAKRSKLPVASEKHVAEQSLSCGTETLGK